MSYALNQEIVAKFSEALEANEFGVEEEVTLEHIVDLALTAVFAEGGVWVLAGSDSSDVWTAEKIFVTETQATTVDFSPYTMVVFVKFGQSVHSAVMSAKGTPV